MTYAEGRDARRGGHASELRPFATVGGPPPDRSAAERRRGVPRPDLFSLALEQLLSGFSPSEVTADDLRALERRYGLDEETSYEPRLAVWMTGLRGIQAAGPITPVEIRYLRDLHLSFELDTEDVRRAQLAAVAPQFHAALREIVADRVISDEERARLAMIAADLEIPADAAAEVLERTARLLLDRLWRSVTTGGHHLSVADAAQVRETASALGLRPTPQQQQVLDDLDALVAAHQRRIEDELAQREEDEARLRALFDRVCAGTPLPSGAVKVRLDSGESCYCAEPVEWHEMVPDETNRFTPPHLAYLDSGTLYLTDRRLVFEGQRLLTSIRHDELSGATQQPDALRVERSAGRDVFLVMQPRARVDVVALLLARLTGRAGVPGSEQFARVTHDS